MDNYPDHLAPLRLDSLTERESFEDWWLRIDGGFSGVPPNVAEQWIHRHWGMSHYEWIPSDGYQYTLEDWPSDRLREVKSGLCNWDYSGDIDHGRYLAEELQFEKPLVDMMLRDKCFPEPIIIMDNRDGHLVPGISPVPESQIFPTGYVLMEGHARFTLAAYLMDKGTFTREVNVWVMHPILRAE